MTPTLGNDIPHTTQLEKVNKGRTVDTLITTRVLYVMTKISLSGSFPVAFDAYYISHYFNLNPSWLYKD